MTDTITTTPTRVDRPVSVRRRGTFPGRLLRWIAYDARLVSLGVQTMADAVTGENRTEASRLEQLTRSEWPQSVASGQSAEREGAGEVAGSERVMSRRSAEPGGGELFGFGLVTSVLGVVSWFLGVLLVMAVVRGAFYGFVEDGPFGVGTWGGPTKAGAWVAHAAISVPIIAGLLFVFRGIGWLHGELVRRLYGVAGGWVLPATISVCAGALWLIWSWIQQL